MSAMKFSLRLLVLAATVVTGSWSMAKDPFHPFAESMDFDPDYQWFARVPTEDLDETPKRKRANKGWFATYDALRIGFDRPEIQSQSSKIDMTLGHRFDVGFMSEKDTGLLFSSTMVDGPNAYFDLRSPTGALLPNSQTLFPVFPVIRERFPYDPFVGDGTRVFRQSLNVGSLSSFELNKTWRMEPYHYGGFFEPMVGFRYMNFKDVAFNEGQTLLDTDGDLTTAEDILFRRETTTTENRMPLAQIGYRYYRPIKRFIISNDLRVFAGQNYQTQQYQNRQYRYIIDDYLTAPTTGAGGAAADGPFNYAPVGFQSGLDNEETVVGFDTRLELGVQVARNVVVRGGFQFLYIGRGIWRGSNPGFGDQGATNQNIVSPAFTFGATLNR